MKPKNVVLLGFVNKAVEYLNNHADDASGASLTELKNIDLETLKAELDDELKDSLDKPQSDINTLMNAGEEAFDKFMNAKGKKEDLSIEFDRIFDVDFDDDAASDQKEELNDLLSLYDLSDELETADDVIDNEEEEEINELIDSVEDFFDELPEEDEDVKFLEEIQKNIEKENKARIEEENKARIKKENEARLKEEKEARIEKEKKARIEKENEARLIEEIQKSFEESEAVPETEEDDTPFELNEEEIELLKTIASNVNRIEDRNQVYTGEAKELDSIFSELVAAENNVPAPEEHYETPTINRIQEYIRVDIPDEEQNRFIENPLVDFTGSDEEERVQGVYPEQVDKNDIVNLMKDITPLSDTYYSEIEDFIDRQEREEAEKKEAHVSDDKYISTLIDDLKNKMDVEAETKRLQEEAYRETYEKIHKAYPYLSDDFIRNVYEMKGSIADEYPLDEKIVILHRTHFKDVENLRQYVEIALKHGFMMNADEKKMIVDVFKQYTNTDGKVITSIFEVANQSALLSGDYEGYRVLFEDDLQYKR